MKNKEVIEKVREICTTHGEDGTSAYLLPEDRFQQLFALIKEELHRQREEIVAELEAYNR